jgi:hypothetical protein
MLRNVNVIKYLERLWKQSILKEASETKELNLIPDPTLDFGLINDLIRLTDKTGLQNIIVLTSGMLHKTPLNTDFGINNERLEEGSKMTAKVGNQNF